MIISIVRRLTLVVNLTVLTCHGSIKDSGPSRKTSESSQLDWHRRPHRSQVEHEMYSSLFEQENSYNKVENYCNQFTKTGNSDDDLYIDLQSGIALFETLASDQKGTENNIFEALTRNNGCKTVQKPCHGVKCFNMLIYATASENCSHQ